MHKGNRMNQKTLYQLSSTGKIKVQILTATANVLHTEWYTVDPKTNKESKHQETSETVEGKNQGRSNGTTAEQQTILEWERKITKKKEEGYSETMPSEENTAEVNLAKVMPQEFAPSKPISEKPAQPFDGSWLAERKYDGQCVLLHNTGSESITYSRRMIQNTAVATVIADVADKLAKVPSQSLFIGEVIATKNGKNEPRLLKGLLSDKTTAAKAKERYDALLADGVTVEFKCYDVLFLNGEDCTAKPFTERLAVTEKLFGKRDIEVFTEKLAAKGKKLGWEGYILRQADSTIGFTLNGKPKRLGGNKYKYLTETDVIVTGIANGKGKHANRFARFYLSQYKDGQLINCGWAGQGQLTDKQLDELTSAFLSKGYVIGKEQKLATADWFMLELEYQSRQEMNDEGEYCFEFGIPLRVRENHEKSFTECEY